MTPDLPAPASELKPPAGLTKAEREEWARHVRYIRGMGCESEVDAAMLEGAVRHLCRARAADVVIAKSGPTYISPKGARVRRPETVISRESWQAYERMSAAFGISPAARAKLGKGGKAPERAGDVPAGLRDA